MKSTARHRRAQEAREAQLDLVFSALSHRTRRAMLARLGRAPANVTELAAPFDMSLPAASKHLRVLERAGLVTRSIEGRVHRCALDAAPLEDADAWLSRYRVFWDESLESLAALVEDETEEQPNE